jgi:hypothetical protein
VAKGAHHPAAELTAPEPHFPKGLSEAIRIVSQHGDEHPLPPLRALNADADGDVLLADQDEVCAEPTVQRWRDRLGEIPSTARLAAWLRLVMPGDAECPPRSAVSGAV